MTLLCNDTMLVANKGVWMKSVGNIWKQGQVLRSAFREHKVCMRSVYAMADDVLQSPAGTPAEFSISMDSIPASFYSVRKNLFSVLFMSIYMLLDVRQERRALYGKLNHLFRTWVTSADNLLDNESKVVIPLKINGESHVMREVVAIMTADRVLARVLSEAVRDGVISADESNMLSELSLQVLLPSAAQEASEESGVMVRPDPEYVFSTIHRYKTGLLFHIPLLGPESIECGINQDALISIKSGLMNFGLGCQLLDDVRDVGRDLRETRHNYVLSLLKKDFPEKYERLVSATAPDRLYHHLPEVVMPTAKRGLSVMRQGLAELNDVGLGIETSSVDFLATSMFKVLDLEDLSYV